MRRNIRKNKNQEDDLSMKIIKYSSIGVAILIIIVLSLLIYSKNLNDEVKEGTLTSEQISNILNSTNNQINIENTESASSEIGKSIEESKEDLEQNILDNTISIDSSTIENTNVLTTNNVKPVSVENKRGEQSESINDKKEENIQLNFEKPVEGEIVVKFSTENLVYSQTLEEWTTHTGIDIKADKTTVVKSSEAGTVKTIKNDPRYGLTITIEHENGFQTVYSNLLSSEFVVEGEKIEKGQALGTVGNTAAFEIADEPHLHFEILKDGEYVDPNIYLK